MKGKLWLIIFSIALFALNIWLVWPLFQGGYTQYMGSIECQLLAQTKFISENFGSFSWYPFWYFGFPVYFIYLPVVSFTLAFIHNVTNIPISDLYRFISGIFYALGGVSVFFLVRTLTKKNIVGLISGLVYSFFPSVCYLIGGIREVGQEVSWAPWRMVVFGNFGEGAHIWALAFTPLALLFIYLIYKKPSVLNWILGVLFTVIVFLTSVTAFMPLFVLIIILAISQICQKEIGRRVLKFLMFLFFVFGLSAFWYNFSFMKNLFGFAGPAGGGSFFTGLYANPSLIIFLSFPLIAIFIVFIVPLFRKRPNFPLYFFAIFSFLVLFLTLLFRYQFNTAFIPMPFGYLPRIGPEVDLAFVILLGVLLSTFFDKISHFSKVFGLVLGIIFVILTLAMFPRQKEAIYEIIKPNKDVTETSEYQVSNWLSENTKEDRIYATGTHAFWLNAFSDVSQMRGAGDQAIVDPLWPHLWYQLYWGDDGELATNWLKAVGIKYIVVNFPESKVTYHDFRYPYKFDEILERKFEYQGDVIYEVPLQHTRIVAIANKEQLNNVGTYWDIKEGKEVLNEDKLERYLAATENSEDFIDLDYSYEKPWKEMEIKAPKIEDGQGILVRMSYHPGWQAYQNNKKLEIKKDPLGFILIDTEAGKDQTILLKFKPTLDVYLGYVISFLILILFIFFLIRNSKKSSGRDEKDKKIISREQKPIEFSGVTQDKSFSEQMEAYRQRGKLGEEEDEE